MLDQASAAYAASEEWHFLRPYLEALFHFEVPEEEHFIENKVEGYAKLLDAAISDLRRSSAGCEELLGVLTFAEKRIRKLLVDFHRCDVQDAIKDVRIRIESHLSRLRKPIQDWSCRGNRRDTKITEAVNSILGIHKFAFRPEMIDFSSVVETAKTFRLDRRGFRFALNHLLLNSEEAVGSQPGHLWRRGMIQVWAGETREGSEEFLEFRVADNGPGMTAEQVRLIHSGSCRGIGTRTVTEIAKLNRGYLKYDSVPGGGTVARVGFNLDLVPEARRTHCTSLLKGGKFHAA